MVEGESKGIGKLPLRWQGLGGRIKRARDYDAAGITPEAYEAQVLSKGRLYEAREIGNLIQQSIPVLQEDGTPTKVLDIAAGTGILSRDLTERGYSVVAVDLSEGFLDYLSRQSPDIATVRADMNVGFPEIPDDSFDVVTMLGSNRYITDTEQFLSEVKRVLKPDGNFVWPVLARESKLWKKNAGKDQPTTVPELDVMLSKRGFVTISGEISYFPRGSSYEEDKNRPIGIVIGKKRGEQKDKESELPGPGTPRRDNPEFSDQDRPSESVEQDASIQGPDQDRETLDPEPRLNMGDQSIDETEENAPRVEEDGPDNGFSK